jgi:SAM-dependent methyltransferase
VFSGVLPDSRVEKMIREKSDSANAITAPKPGMKTRRHFFSHYLRYASVSHSLWRCYECERFSRETLKAPVLDLGCGDGFFAQAVFGRLDAGIDLDEGEVGRAIGRGVYSRALVADAARMPFQNASFNTVVSNCVMEHIPDIDRVLSEVRRVLKPGGRLFITVPSEYWNSESYFSGIFKSLGLDFAARLYHRLLDKASKHFHVDDQSVWKNRFGRAGLKMTGADYLISPRVLHVFERWLVTAIPSKICKALFKRWALLPRFWAPGFYNWWFKGMLEEESNKGVCYFLTAVKPKK